MFADIVGASATRNTERVIIAERHFQRRNKMTFSIVAVMDGLTQMTMIVCATYAAIYFNNPKYMFLCLMAALFGHKYEKKTENGSHAQKID